MAYGRLTYKISATQAKLNATVDAALDKALSRDNMEVNGVEVQLSKSGLATGILEGKALLIDVPLDIHIKRKAGLFTVEGTGGISIKLKLNYDINRDLQFKFKTELVAHEWITKPVLEVGALNIPVETLMNLVLGHYESVLVSKIDAALNEKSDFVGQVYQALQQLETKVNDILPFDNAVDLKLGTLDTMTPRSSNNRVELQGNIEMGLSVLPKLASTNDLLPTINWTDKVQAAVPITVDIQLSYSDLANQATEQLSGVDMGGRKIVVSDMVITYEEELQIEVELTEPIKGTVSLTGEPDYMPTTGELAVAELDVKVKPSNFIYKMTAPLVNKFIEGKLEELLPISLQAIVDRKLAELPKEIAVPDGILKPSLSKADIKAIEFDAKGVNISIELNDVHVEILIA